MSSNDSSNKTSGSPADNTHGNAGRTAARELALQVLFQMEFTLPIPLDEFVKLYGQSTTKENLDYTHQLVEGVVKNKAAIDELIQGNSHHWKIERIALVEKNILRVALFETNFASAPMKPSIAINEAINLAKKYGSKESGGFVNGILDQITKSTNN